MYSIAISYILAIAAISVPLRHASLKPPPKEYLEEFLDLMNSSLNKLLDGDDLENILNLNENSQIGDGRGQDQTIGFAGKHKSGGLQNGLESKDPSKRDASEFPSKSQADTNEVLRQTSGNKYHLNRPVDLNLGGTQKEPVSGIEGFQDMKFHPSIGCDRFDASRRHCVLVRQLGSTITLGVNVAGPLRPGSSVRWYRYLKKQPSDHFIRENLKRDFLPWNLNLGGSQRELRISPVTETDRAYNYFVAELNAQAAYRQNNFAGRPVIRFTIEPVHLDMGPLYHGEEIVLYARSHMEVPPRSVQFHWSLFEPGDMQDRGLPSNMRLNADRSSVVIKELKTYQNQILSCTVYSNKNVFLARRDFLFRGSVYDEAFSTQSPSNPRLKRDLYSRDLQQPEDSNAEVSYEFHQNPGPVYPEQKDEAKRWKDSSSGPKSHPSIEEQSGQRQFRSDENADRNPELSTEDSTQVPENIHLGPLKFDDVESQITASCGFHLDCNVHAVCTRASYSGQKFCKCLRGYRGNGVFCMIELQ